MKRLLALMTAVVMVFAMASVAFADSPTTGVTVDVDTTTQSMPDGTTVTTTETTGADGTEVKTVTTTTADGTTVVETTSTAQNGNTVVETATTNPDGETETEVELEVSAEAAEEEVAYFAYDIEAAPSLEAAPAIKVTVNTNEDSQIERIGLNVSNGDNNTVVYLVDANGEAKLLKDTLKSDDGVTFPVGEDGSFTVKVVDNAKTFEDDASVAAWAAAGVEFATSRELFVGNDKQELLPTETMSRAEMVTVLSRVADADIVTTGENWSAAPMAWANSLGMNHGSDPDEDISREELAFMLYRLAGSPEVEGDLSAFADAATVSDWAADAMQWAFANRIFQGDGTNLNPTATATRQEIMLVLARFYTVK